MIFVGRRHVPPHQDPVAVRDPADVVIPGDFGGPGGGKTGDVVSHCVHRRAAGEVRAGAGEWLSGRRLVRGEARTVGEGYGVVCSGCGGLVSADHGTHVRVVTDTDNVTCIVADTDNVTCIVADTDNVT